MLDQRFTQFLLAGVIGLLLFTGCSKLIPQQELTIGIIGDQTGSYDLDASYVVLDSAVAKLIRRNPDIVLHVGDMVESISGINSFEDYKEDYETAAGLMDRFGVPWYMTTGDHDVNPPGYTPNSPDRSREEWFKTLSVEQGFPVQDHLYYSADFQGYHFIFLNSLEHLHTDPRWGNVFLNKISHDQLAWLLNDLEENRRAKGIIVVVHHPQWYAWTNWQPVHDLLKWYPVVAVLSGHFHYDQRDATLDGIHYLIMGSTGGAVKECDANSGGAQEYGMMTLRGRELVDFSLYNVENDDTLEVTPRVSMDRMQAVSAMFTNSWGDESLYWDGKEIVTQTANGSMQEVNSIGLESLGNPLDLPLTLRLVSQSGPLGTPMWNRNGESWAANTPLVLDPGERIGWANTSNVGQFWTMAPLVQAQFLNISKNPGSLTLVLEARFEDTESRWLRYDARFGIQTSLP